MIRRRALGGLLLVLSLLSAPAESLRARDDSDAPAARSDFKVDVRYTEGQQAKRATRLLKESPGAPETFEALLNVSRLDAALSVLSRAVAGDSETVRGVLTILSKHVSDFLRDQVQEYPSRIRTILVPVRASLSSRPRKEAVELARSLVTIDSQIGTPESVKSLAAFVQAYDDTENPLEGQVSLLNQGSSLRTVANLERFAGEHQGTVAGAEADYLAAVALAYNSGSFEDQPNKRERDPTDRLERVARIVDTLESGAFPRCEWTERAASLEAELFVSDTPPPVYAPGNVDRSIAIYTAFAQKHVDSDGGMDSWRSQVPFVVTSKLADLYELKGDRNGGVDRTLDDLDRRSADPVGVRLYRAYYYAHEASVEGKADRPAMIRRAHAIYNALATGHLGARSGRALAADAELYRFVQDYPTARAGFDTYIREYPTSPWTWVAALRIGECDERLGDVARATADYRRAATLAPSEAYATVLGNFAAARTLAAQGRFDESLAAATVALDRWDSDYGVEYQISTDTGLPLQGEPNRGPALLDITLTDLRTSVENLRRDLKQPDGSRLAKGRFELDRRQFSAATESLRSYVATHPEGAATREARVLLHRAQLEVAFDLGAVDGPNYNKAAAAKALDALAVESLDSVIGVARLARAALRLLDNDRTRAKDETAAVLNWWMADGQSRIGPPPPPNSLEADVLEIRRVVFRPRGDLDAPGGLILNAFEFPAQLPPFVVFDPEVSYRTADGAVQRKVLYQSLPGLDHVLQLDSDTIGLMSQLLSSLGGSAQRARRAVMETPNQPIGGSMAILGLWREFFDCRPGHWGGWVLSTYPAMGHIEFLDATRTKATVPIVVGYSGATVVLEKIDGKWKATRMVNHWVT